MSQIERIGVAGAGTMGSGIAQVAAMSGLTVEVYDVRPEQLERCRDTIQSSLEKFVRKNKMSPANRDATLTRLRFQASVDVLAGCDYIIEAVSEDASIKEPLLAQIGKATRPETVLASNTSSISITRLGTASGRPDRFIGMHFFNPVPVMPLVEVVVGASTNSATIELTEDLARRMNKTPLRVKDAPGFVANRVLMPLINEAVFALAEGIGDAATIDQIMVLGCGHPMGPLALADLIGLDVCLSIMKVIEEGTGDAKFRPCPLLVEMVAAGQLGRKTKRGFFEYA